MSRPRHWAPLAAADPVPGDAEEIAALAQRYADTATAIRDARDTLARIDTHDGWDSDAGKEFRASTRKAAEQVGRALVRYERAAEGLSAYVRSLRHVQAVAGELLLQARSAQDHLDLAVARERTAAAAAPETPEALALPQRQAAVAEAQGRIASLRRTVDEQLRPQWDDAGNLAAAALQEISSIDGLEDSRWDDFGGVMQAVGTWAGKAAAVLGVLALVCAIVPGLQPFAALFGALALAASVLSLAGHGVAYSQGRASLSDVLWATAGVLTFGAGRAFTSAARALGKGAASTAKPSYVAALRRGGATKKAARNQARQVDWSGTRHIPHGAAARARAGGRVPWLPRPREVASAVNPRTMAREAVDDVRHFRRPGPLPSEADGAALAAAKGLPAEVRATPEVSAALRRAKGATSASTGAGVGSSYNDARELLGLPPQGRPTLPGSGGR